jgi:TM2 domain-containing membrane protein YozV
MGLTPEERERIYLEEKARLEIRRQLEAENPSAPRLVIPVAVKNRPSNGTAAVLSLFIPGAGQMYKGNTAKGFGWLLGAGIGYMLLIVPGIIVHIVCIFNAATSDPADERNEAEEMGETVPTPNAPNPLSILPGPSSDEIRWRALNDKKF